MCRTAADAAAVERDYNNTEYRNDAVSNSLELVVSFVGQASSAVSVFGYWRLDR